MEYNEITFYSRKTIFNVYNELGPGLLESVYEKVLIYELNDLGLKVQSQIPVPIIYKNIPFDTGFRSDLIVENKVIVKIKSVEEISPVHHKQLLTYLKLSGYKLGILVNFNTDCIDKSIVRKINGTI